MNLQKGDLGEKIAASYLKEKGFEIIEKNFKTKFGELDIIAKKNSKIHFIEVKTRVGTQKGAPHEAVNWQKLQHLKRIIQFYIKRKKMTAFKLSLDVVSIVLNNDNSVATISFYESITN